MDLPQTLPNRPLSKQVEPLAAGPPRRERESLEGAKALSVAIPLGVVLWALLSVVVYTAYLAIT